MKRSPVGAAVVDSEAVDSTEADSGAGGFMGASAGAACMRDVFTVGDASVALGRHIQLQEGPAVLDMASRVGQVARSRVMAVIIEDTEVIAGTVTARQR